MEVEAVEEGWIEGIIGVEMIIEREGVGVIDGTTTTVIVTTAHVKIPPDVEVLIQTETIVHHIFQMVTRKRTRKKKKASEYCSA